VVPIFVRSLETQSKFFDAEQNNIYDELKSRQYVQLLLTDFISLPQTRQATLISDIADDIEGMITRLREMGDLSDFQRQTATVKPSRQLDPKAQNYENVDLIVDADVSVKSSDTDRRVRAQVSFVERLFVEGSSATFQFAVRRAFLSIYNRGVGKLKRVTALRTGLRGAHYVVFHHAPEAALTVCLNPQGDRPALGDLSLPPDSGCNFWSTVATMANDVKTADLSAELTIEIGADGLFIAGDQGGAISSSRKEKVQAILEIATRKAVTNRSSVVGPDGFLRRQIPVVEET
jgi:hypothetical protein